MPLITLDIPSNSRFHSSLNEIDMAVSSVLQYQLRLADPRSKSRLQSEEADPDKNDWLWDKSRIFQVDEMTTDEIFDTYLLRKNMNKEKNVDISYPLLAFKQEDVDTVFWGEGQRKVQWDIELKPSVTQWKPGEEVAIVSKTKYRGLRAFIAEVKNVSGRLFFTLSLNGTVITQKNKYGRPEPVYFSQSDLKPIAEKLGSQFRAKAITCKYSCVILCDNRDEIQYIRDHYMLRVADFKGIWWRYASPTIENNENQIFTVFGIPNIDRYPSSSEKLKGHGYIYGTSFNIAVWATITDAPIPQHIIENIRMNLSVEGDGRTNRIVINGAD